MTDVTGKPSVSSIATSDSNEIPKSALPAETSSSGRVVV